MAARVQDVIDADASRPGYAVRGVATSRSTSRPPSRTSGACRRRVAAYMCFRMENLLCLVFSCMMASAWRSEPAQWHARPSYTSSKLLSRSSSRQPSMPATTTRPMRSAPRHLHSFRSRWQRCWSSCAWRSLQGTLAATTATGWSTQPTSTPELARTNKTSTRYSFHNPSAALLDNLFCLVFSCTVASAWR